MEEKKQISIIPNIKNGIYYIGDFEVKTNLDLKSTVNLIELALTKSKDLKNVEQSTKQPLIGEKLKVCLFPAGENDVQVVSDFKLEPTLHLLHQAYLAKITLLFQNNYVLYRNNS